MKFDAKCAFYYISRGISVRERKREKEKERKKEQRELNDTRESVSLYLFLVKCMKVLCLTLYIEYSVICLIEKRRKEARARKKARVNI